jgi:hypothetical protein
MALLPSTLFHFTNKKSLKGILKFNFKLSYCTEKINNLEKPVEIAIPMVSFCDIRLSEIKDHIEKYGYYGIGLSKIWAIEKNLNPVIYMNSKSNFVSDFISTTRKLDMDENFDKIDKFNIVNILRYAKLYEGELKRRRKTISNYRFADEREWRYIPKNNSNFKSSLPNNIYIEDKKKYNKQLINEGLYFNANQILYIIVKRESEIKEIINHIRETTGHYSMDEVDRLTTRIISCERILNDF